MTYEYILNFKKNYPTTIAWRLKKHSAIIDKHLNPDEKVIYAFMGQKNDRFYDIFGTAVIALTNKRILIAQKRVVFGYKLNAITPDLFNDMQVYQGLIFGKVTIDTIKEKVVISNLSKHSLPEIETQITSFMMSEKQKYKNIETENR